MTRTLLALALAVAACGGYPVPEVPWESDLPPGGVVIYHVDHGLGVCGGMTGCPTRIVSVDSTCITETWHGYWVFRESKPCAAP